MQEFLAQCEAAVLEGDRQLAGDLASRALNEGFDVLRVIEDGFAVGIRGAGALWEKGEYFLPELAFSAEAMKAAMTVLQPALLANSGGNSSKGTVVIGTVQGDIHDIGKTLVATMLSANGYHVIDLGSDIPHTRFLEEARQHKPGFLCMSALLTTTMSGQRDVVELLEKERLQNDIKIVVGGAPTSSSWAKEIGADGYAENAIDAVKVIDSLL